MSTPVKPIVMPDPSVVHVPAKDLTFKQACEFKELFSSDAGRNELILWLQRNDPIVAMAYMMAREQCPDDVDAAVIIIMANAFRNVRA